MVIKDELLEPYRIETDTSGTYNVVYAYIGSQEDSKNYGKEIYNTLGYFSSIGSAINFIIQKKIQNKDEVVTLKEYIKELKDYRNDLKFLLTQTV